MQFSSTFQVVLLSLAAYNLAGHAALAAPVERRSPGGWGGVVFSDPGGANTPNCTPSTDGVATDSPTEDADQCINGSGYDNQGQ